MKILLPIDGSEVSLEAVRHAIALRREGLRAEFVLANVQEPATLYEMVRAPDPHVLDEIRVAAGSHVLLAAEALLRDAGMEATEVLVSGDPAHALVEIIEREGCDAVIMGSHGSGALRSAFAGSVSHDLIHGSPVPVTLVKLREAAEVPAEEDLGSQAVAS
ncbi:MAG: universal stress protein [Vitreoscilla sp.]|nr:universal stress protein [Vitreoscilla sp.]